VVFFQINLFPDDHVGKENLELALLIWHFKAVVRAAVFGISGKVYALTPKTFRREINIEAILGVNLARFK
jgi:hypothetical protein